METLEFACCYHIIFVVGAFHLFPNHDVNNNCSKRLLGTPRTLFVCSRAKKNGIRYGYRLYIACLLFVHLHLCVSNIVGWFFTANTLRFPQYEPIDADSY